MKTTLRQLRKIIREEVKASSKKRVNEGLEEDVMTVGVLIRDLKNQNPDAVVLCKRGLKYVAIQGWWPLSAGAEINQGEGDIAPDGAVILELE